ncbi:hypothetical protein F5148DRAFT_591587 [Russula earlei]|uniref:Uncharacterized protein n=1 Tax=Russula earlei TaxID=71964 RepID=A0ACC0UFT8_9AGAM|nr:hypothetical protein F5148DRAFT_591587 [Russula earlei]
MCVAWVCVCVCAPLAPCLAQVALLDDETKTERHVSHAPLTRPPKVDTTYPIQKTSRTPRARAWRLTSQERKVERKGRGRGDWNENEGVRGKRRKHQHSRSRTNTSPRLLYKTKIGRVWGEREHSEYGVL